MGFAYLAFLVLVCFAISNHWDYLLLGGRTTIYYLEVVTLIVGLNMELEAVIEDSL